MARMYAEHTFPRSTPTRDALAQLMAELDQHAAINGHRVKGEVTITEYESALELTRHLRIEGDVEPAV